MEIKRKFPRLQTVIEGKSMTQQEFKEECDVNNILKRYKQTGNLELLNRTNGKFLDVSDSGTYQEAMNIVVQAQQTFDQLPSDLRKKLANDPTRLLEIVEQAELGNEDATKFLIANKLGTERIKEVINAGPSDGNSQANASSSFAASASASSSSN